MASDSLTNTNISNTYVGVLHARGEAIPASGLVDVYDGFGNKSSLQIGRDGEGINVSGPLGSNFIDTLYPVGSIIFSADNTDPGDRFPNTEWVQEAEGRFIAGVGTGNDGTEEVAIAAGNDSVGEYKHTLTEPEMPAHRHVSPYGESTPSLNWRWGTYQTNTLGVGSNGGYDYDNLRYGFTTYAGGQSTEDGETVSPTDTTPHNNLPPTFGMYVWKRTA